ncbi:antibiotic biosynthesis monooxygenase family protein [Bradyrhizobium sp. OAE829]|uniref:putative quinol monooxygenase n=1 Tax=Bradyrhizobium sp. OAE829 TaxID=2663807 RepID=UPI00178A9E22
MARIAIAATLKAVPGKRDELILQCRELAPLFIEQEPGTLRLELLLPPDDPETLVLWEVYESADALAAHQSGELLKRFRSAIEGTVQSMSATRHDMLE